MLVENRTARILVVSLLVLLVIPLLVMLGMMMFGGAMMAQMGGGMHMGAGLMALCFLWTLLMAAALIGLIVLVTRGSTSTRHREIPSANMRSALPH
jgi:uncharacterized membrane protein